MKEYGVLLSFGDLYEEKGAGKRITPADGGIVRILATHITLRDDATLIATAGYNKQNPRHPTHERTVSLAEQTKRFLEEAGACEKIYAIPLCWGTRNEIGCAIRILKIREKIPVSEKVRIVIASHPVHLFRVRMYMQAHMPKEWHVEFVPVRHAFPLKSYLQEIWCVCRDYVFYWKLHRRRKKIFA